MNNLYGKLWAKTTAVILLVIMSVGCLVSGTGIAVLLGFDAYSDLGQKMRQEAMQNLAQEKIYLAADFYRSYVSAAQEDGYIKDDITAAPKVAATELKKLLANDSLYDDIGIDEPSNFYFTVTDSQGKECFSNLPAAAKNSDYETLTEQQYDITVASTWQKTTETFSNYDSMQEYIDSVEYNDDITVGDYRQQYNDKSKTDEYILNIEQLQTTTAPVLVTAYLDSALTVKDDFYQADQWLRLLTDWRIILIPVFGVTLILTLLLLLFLLRSAGHKQGVAGIHLNWLDRLPLDLYLIIAITLVCIPLSIGVSGVSLAGKTAVLISLLLGGIICELIVLAFILSLAARIKSGRWWANTIIYRLLQIIRRIGGKSARGLRYALQNLPLYWKTGIIFAGVSLLELLVIIIGYNDYGFLVLFWLAEKIIILPLLILLVLNLRKLQAGGEAIAGGKLQEKIDLKHLLGDFRRHGENLNSINDGMQTAISEKMKGEHFKTELITNVSHDLKTPLTSIVNYVDLLKGLDLFPETAKEYVDVLDRQSARLKKLTEDLVEASKASTGNLTVNREPTEVNVLLQQTAGEYEEKLLGKKLDLQLQTTADSPMIMADARLLWRVFDNLLNNICKYAQSGTRVYLVSEAAEDTVTVSFKNISAAPLNISCDELMERFVRGDRSRSTEGSGLGLSIARSLTELQGGHFAISIDGDLFKATVSFKKA